MSPLETARQEFRRARKEELQRAGESRPAAEKPLEDIRVGDIMLSPYGEERKVTAVRPKAVEMEGGKVAYRPDACRNPEFRVGDTVRWRNLHHGTFTWPTWRGLDAPQHEYALVSRAAEKKPEKRAEPWVMPAVFFPPCRICGHAPQRGRNSHYASCDHNPEAKVSRIQHLGWDQPAPIVVLAQNEEDVP